MRAIPDDTIKYPVQIKIGQFGGSGYYLNNNDKEIFLITAKHVIYNKDNSFLGSTVSLASFPKEDINDCIKIHIDLSILEKNKHILTDEENDIIALKITENTIIQSSKKSAKLTSGCKIINIPTGATLLTAELPSLRCMKDVLVGNDVYLIGYPSSIGSKEISQIDYNNPLMKKGIIAGKNELNKTIILDCEVYPGNSGGIVIELEQINATKKVAHVIGVVSQFVPFQKKWFQNSGYSIVVPIDPILNLINK